MKAIAQGLRDYVQKYGEVPIVDHSQDLQDCYLIIGVLSGSKSGRMFLPDALFAEGLNPDGINFIPSVVPGPCTGLHDPWGNSYYIALDRDLDRETEIEHQDDQTFAFYPPMTVRTTSTRSVSVRVRSHLAVWSAGPNGLNECGYGDDICSWMR